MQHAVHPEADNRGAYLRIDMDMNLPLPCSASASALTKWSGIVEVLSGGRVQDIGGQAFVSFKSIVNYAVGHSYRAACSRML